MAAKSRGSATQASLPSTSRGKKVTGKWHFNAAPIAVEKKAEVAKVSRVRVGTEPGIPRNGFCIMSPFFLTQKTPPKRGRRSVAPAAIPAQPQAPVSRAKKAAPEKPKRKAAPPKKALVCIFIRSTYVRRILTFSKRSMTHLANSKPSTYIIWQ